MVGVRKFSGCVNPGLFFEPRNPSRSKKKSLEQLDNYVQRCGFQV